MDVQNTRNFALIGHAGDGKTTLGEALLFKAGATQEQGDVVAGTSVLNTFPEEKDGHTATIAAHPYTFEHRDRSLTLVDTPGDPNFMGDSLIALQALDGAVLVASASDGVKVGTDKLARAAKASGVAMLGFINGMDHERADFDACLASLASLELKTPVLTFPIGSGPDFAGVVDTLRMRAVTAAGEVDIPAELVDEAETRRLELVELVAECDDALLEKYLEEGELSQEDVEQGLVTGTRSGALTPILCGAATLGLGVDSLLYSIGGLLPSPVERGEWDAKDLDGDGDQSLKPDADAPFAGIVFKTIIDRYAGTLSVIRVVSGTLEPDSSLLNASTGEKTRVGKLHTLTGEKHSERGAAVPGEIVAVAKLKGAHTGHSLCAEKAGARLPNLLIPQGVLSYAIDAPEGADEDKVYASLGRLVEEDPTLHLGRDAMTGEFLLSGMGELHIRTTVHKLQRMFDVDVNLKTPKVPYRETITRSVEHVEGKLKKQTGGKGMFGVCYLSLEPRQRGEGFEFVDKIVGGAIPRSLIPAVEKGVLEACETGPLAGYPVVDVSVKCIDGKHHPVDSNEMAFKLAGSFGFKAAMEQAGPTLLEPIMDVQITVPDENVGDVMGDVSSKRGRVQTSESKGAGMVVLAQVPMAEMLEFSTQLTAMTGGKGAFEMSFSHYESAPANVQEKIIASQGESAAKQH